MIHHIEVRVGGSGGHVGSRPPGPQPPVPVPALRGPGGACREIMDGREAEEGTGPWDP